MSKNNNFWFFTLCLLLVLTSINGWNIYMRIAVVLNAIVVLLSVILKIRSFTNGKHKEV